MKGNDLFVSLLQVAFIVLKLTGHIEWSWVWVLAPTWIGILIAVVGLAVFHSAFKGR